MTTVMMVVQMVLVMLMLLQMMTVLMAEARVHRVPGTDNLRFWPMRQDVEDTERLDPAIVGLSFSLVLLVRVLHLYHLQTFQRLEIIIGRSGGCRTVATSPAVYLFFFFFVFFVVSERCNRVAALASPATGSSVRHPVLSVARIIPLFVLRHRISHVGSSGTQTVDVVLPGGSQLVLRVRRHDHQWQRARTAHGDLVLVVLDVSSTWRASARRPSVRRRAAHAAGRCCAGRYRRRRRHRVRFRHLRGTHASRMKQRELTYKAKSLETLACLALGSQSRSRQV